MTDPVEGYERHAVHRGGEALGHRVLVPDRAVCCGALPRHAGEESLAGTVEAQTRAALVALPSRHVLACASGCLDGLRRHVADGEALAVEEGAGPAEDLLALDGMDDDTAHALAAHGVRTSEDLSDLAADEVAEFGIEGLDEQRAAALILAARAEEIARLERGE